MDENKEYLEVDEQEPEIPEETTPNLTGLFESLQSDDDEHDHDDDDEDDDHGIHTDLDDFDEDAPDDNYAENQLEQIMESTADRDEINDYFDDLQTADFVEELDDLDDEQLGLLIRKLKRENLTELMEEADDDMRQRMSKNIADSSLL